VPPTTRPDLLAIFDHDGVLVDSFGFHRDAWLELGRRADLPITEAFVLETFGMTNPAIFDRLVGGALDPAEVARLGDLKEECYRDVARGRITLMDGVLDLIDALSALGVALAIGTSGPRANMLLTVESCGLDGRFASIVALEDVRRGKPDPEVFRRSADRLGIDPSKAVVFEDAPVGIRAAKAAGMLAVGITSTRPAAELREAGADEVVDSLLGYPAEALVSRLRRARPGGGPP
jgi:beta-phosphoglucomutase